MLMIASGLENILVVLNFAYKILAMFKQFALRILLALTR